MTGAVTHRVVFLLGPERVELRRVARPEPGAGELLLRVDAATTCGTDLKVWRRGGHPRMLEVPCPFGHEVAGTVVAVGRGSDRWREGDRLVIANSASCGRCEACRAGRENLCSDLQYLNGAFAEHVVVPSRFVERSSWPAPAGVDPAVAALAEPLACVEHGLSMIERLQADEVIVLGAGPIGLLFVIELAHRGRRTILGDMVAARLEVGARLGAAETVLLAGDAGDSDRLLAVTGDRCGAELVIEATGATAAWSNALRVVRVGGEVVLFGGCAPGTEVAVDTHRLHYSELLVRGVYHHRPETFARALERLAEDGQQFSELISEEHTLDGVQQALERMARRQILKAAIRP